MDTSAFINLTQIWRESGLGAVRSPGEWIKAAKTKQDLQILAERLNVDPSALYISKRGMGVGMWAHPELEPSYQTFLASPLIGPRERGPSRVEIIGDVALIELKNAAGIAIAHTIIDAEDVGLVNTRRWRLTGGHVAGPGRSSLHRTILQAKAGDIVDHSNRDVLDNRKQNLRFTDALGNTRNRSIQSNNESGVHGVGWHKYAKMWTARITIHRKTITLGYYKTIEEATKVRQEAERMHFGEFAPSASRDTQNPTSSSSQTILTRITKMQCLGFNFNPVPCDGKLCASFDNPDWGAFGKAYNKDLTVAVLKASKLALKQLAAKRLEHIRACKEAATVFTEFDPEKGLL